MNVDQRTPLEGHDMVGNYAGGQAFAIDDQARLRRYLIIGTAGTYYVNKDTLDESNDDVIRALLSSEPTQTVDMIEEVSQSGIAPKNEPAIHALALAACDPLKSTRTYALGKLSRVCRTGAHLLYFASEIKRLRGWGRAVANAIERWYNDLPIDRLVYQTVKYTNREKITHSDVIRLAHPKPSTPDRNDTFRWIRGHGAPPEAHPMIHAYEKMRAEISEREVIDLVREHRLTHEMVPNEYKGSPAVWDALLDCMGIEAMTRNLARMGANGLLTPGSEAARRIIGAFGNADRIRDSRLHPMKILVALKSYGAEATVVRRAGDTPMRWKKVPEVCEALDSAFYTAFANVEPSNKRTMLALDVSGSMDFRIASTPSLSNREASVALAMVTAAIEPEWCAYGFTSQGRWQLYNRESELTPVALDKKAGLEKACEAMRNIPHGGTDCSLPMRHALDAGLEIDTFIIYTDNETYAGPIHPAVALRQYRDTKGIPARLAVVAMTATHFSIADPMDSGMLDVAGFSSDMPAVVGEFSSGRV